jgi:FSR family fosmidomycin resistance protein-like MFS transporter
MSRKIVLSNISVYSLSHALVDAACAATVFGIGATGRAEPRDLILLIILYNVLAFATQPVFGLMVDVFKVSAYTSAFGILLVAASMLLLQAPVAAVLAAGIGNALFHVGGGAVSLNLAPGKAALPGIFVAPGALGLMIGISLGQGGNVYPGAFLPLLLGSAVLILIVPRPEIAAPRKFPGNLRWFETVILLMLVSIAIRSLVGLSLVYPWKSEPVLLVALTGAVVLGKALGGILGDRFGWTAVAVSGLAVSAPLLAFLPQIPAAAILGAFVFNLSMPLTLVCLAEMLPGKAGFAFGLTTLALLIGGAPAYTQLRADTGQPAFLFAAILVSTAALYVGLQLFAGHFARRLSVRQNQARPAEKA